MTSNDDELTIKLRKPISLGEGLYTELHLREPTGGEVVQWDKLQGTEADVRAISIVSGVPEPAVRQLGARDLVKAAKFVSSFLA